MSVKHKWYMPSNLKILLLTWCVRLSKGINFYKQLLAVNHNTADPGVFTFDSRRKFSNAPGANGETVYQSVRYNVTQYEINKIGEIKVQAENLHFAAKFNPY